MNNYQKQNRNNGLTKEDIERQIRNNQYKSKDELADYLLESRKKGLINIDNGQIKELLDLFDNLHQKTDTNLDMNNYSAISLENKDIIISKKQDKILETQEGTLEYQDEFKKTQNEIISNNHEKNVNADQVFEKMANQQKEELTLVSLDEAFVHPNATADLLMKIKFFITNILVNPNVFRINIETGIFYNIENNEAYEVRKNEETKSYEIYRQNEKIYGSSTPISEGHSEEREEEPLTNENTLNQPKVRRLVPGKPSNPNAAFTQISFLIMSLVSFILLTVMTILLMK